MALAITQAIKLIHAARRSQILKFHQIWTRSRASADPDAPHGPDSDPKGYLGTDHTQGIPEQPEITRDCSISQNGRVRCRKVFGHMLGRSCSRAKFEPAVPAVRSFCCRLNLTLELYGSTPAP